MSRTENSNSAEKVKRPIGIRYFWDNIEVSICLISMLLVTVITFAQVVGRYVFSHSFGWSEEISRFLVVWITFGGSAYAFRKGAHIGVTALINKIPGRYRFYVYLMTRLITIFFFIVLGYHGLLHTMQQIANGQVAPATRLPIAIPYSAVPIGSALVIIRLLDQTVRELILGRELEVEEI
ncbi:MAG: TRAP transporter small permease [Bacillota bacterium]